MTDEQRLKASIDQIEGFFRSYYFGWRLAKILINEKVLVNRREFLSDISNDLKQNEEQNPEAIIAQEIANGLGFDILSNCIQYIEDLFVLLRAGKKKEFFIKELITYNAGKVDNLVQEKINNDKLCDLFYFPRIKDFENESEDVKNAVNEGISKLSAKINLIKEFYNTYQFHYNQYKHGLTVALKPYGDLDPSLLENVYNGEINPYLVAIDNLAIKKVSRNQHRFQNYVMMPCLTKNTQPFISELDNEDNLLRYVMCPPETSIANFKNCAFNVRDCLYIFSNNLLSKLRGGDIITLQLPADGRDVYSFDFKNDIAGS